MEATRYTTSNFLPEDVCKAFFPISKLGFVQGEWLLGLFQLYLTQDDLGEEREQLMVGNELPSHKSLIPELGVWSPGMYLVSILTVLSLSVTWSKPLLCSEH